MAVYIGSVTNNSVSNTVTIEFSKHNESYRKLAGLTLIGICLLHCLVID